MGSAQHPSLYFRENKLSGSGALKFKFALSGLLARAREKVAPEGIQEGQPFVDSCLRGARETRSHIRFHSYSSPTLSALYLRISARARALSLSLTPIFQLPRWAPSQKIGVHLPSEISFESLSPTQTLWFSRTAYTYERLHAHVTAYTEDNKKKIIEINWQSSLLTIYRHTCDIAIANLHEMSQRPTSQPNRQRGKALEAEEICRWVMMKCSFIFP